MCIIEWIETDGNRRLWNVPYFLMNEAIILVGILLSSLINSLAIRSQVIKVSVRNFKIFIKCRNHMNKFYTFFLIYVIIYYYFIYQLLITFKRKLFWCSCCCDIGRWMLVPLFPISFIMNTNSTSNFILCVHNITSWFQDISIIQITGCLKFLRCTV